MPTSIRASRFNSHHFFKVEDETNRPMFAYNLDDGTQRMTEDDRG